MKADVADYSEWKFNRRATGIVFAAIVVGCEVGLAIGGAVVRMAPRRLRVCGQRGADPHRCSGHQAVSERFPGHCINICIISSLYLWHWKKVEYQMQDELAERRKAYKA
jgi:hypothetical protein